MDLKPWPSEFARKKRGDGCPQRHVGDPQSMTPPEHAGFWTDVSTVARAIESAFAPIHLNFQILGNHDPHVHVHVVPRYDPDPAPSLPLPEEAWAASSPLTPNELATQLALLRAHVAADAPRPVGAPRATRPDSDFHASST